MSRFSVTTRGAGRADGRLIEIDAPNWLTALGIGLERLGIVTGIDRLACEVQPNGVVLARDVRSGNSFVIAPSASAVPVPSPTAVSSTAARARPAETEEIRLDTEDMVDTAEDGLPPKTAEEAPEEEALALEEDESDPRLAELAEELLGVSTALDAWRVALDGALALIPAESGSALVREWDGTLRFLYARGPRSMQVVGQRIPPGVGIAGFCAGHQIGLLIRDAQQDPRFFSSIDRTSGYRTSSVLAAPVVGAGVCFGCLELLNAPDNFAGSFGGGADWDEDPAGAAPPGSSPDPLTVLERVAAALAECLLTVA